MKPIICIIIFFITLQRSTINKSFNKLDGLDDNLRGYHNPYSLDSHLGVNKKNINTGNLNDELNMNDNEIFEKYFKKMESLDPQTLKEHTINILKDEDPFDPEIKRIEEMDPGEFKYKLLSSYTQIKPNQFVNSMENHDFSLGETIPPSNKNKRPLIDIKPDNTTPDYGFKPIIQVDLS